MSIFTTFGSFSIAAGILLIFLIFVMLAAERRGELGIARAVGTRREPPRADVPLRGPRLRPRRRRRRRARSGVAVAFGMVLAMAAAFARRRRTSASRFSVTPTSIVVAYAHRRAAHARGRRLLGLAREPDEHRQRDPQPARAAVAGKRRRRWLLGVRRARARRRSLIVSGVAPRTRSRSASASRSPSSASSRSRGLPAFPTRVAYTGGRALRWWRWFVLPMSRWLLGDLKIELLDLHPRRPDDRRRRDLADHVQRRRPARRPDDAPLGRIRAPRAGAQDVDGVPAARAASAPA